MPQQQVQWIANNLLQVATTAADQQRWSTLKQFYRHEMPYSKPTIKDEIAVIYAPDNSFKRRDLSIETNKNLSEQIIAAIRIKPVGQYQLVTGLVVAAEYRGLGFAHNLLDFIGEKIKPENCYVFALPHLVSFYQHHGFCEIKRAVNDIQQLYVKYHSVDKPLVLMQLQTH